jgi:GT2 family glycosyltransferase
MAVSLYVSAIIPTKNRPDDLERAVRSLCVQTVPACELVVIDQSESCESKGRIIQLGRESGLTVVYRRDPAISGLAAARNCAMDLAKGDVWLFLDDDIEMEPDFIEQLLIAYQEHPEAAGVSGIITNYTRPAAGFRCWYRFFVRGPFRDERQPLYWRAAKLRSSQPIQVSRFGGGLMSFRREAVRDLRFDAALHGVSDGEDVDFCMRLGSAILLMNPRARLAHHHSPSERLTDHWTRRAIRAQWFLYCKHWNNRPTHRLCAAWLIVGYVVVVAASSVRRLSLSPVRSFLKGLSEATPLAVRTPTTD